jgi:hypothetical protein
MRGQAAAEQMTEFNWLIVLTPLYVIGGAGIVTMIVLILGGLLGFAVSTVKTFPVVAAIALLVLLFTARARDGGA